MAEKGKKISEPNDKTYVRKPEIHYSYRFQPSYINLGGSPGKNMTQEDRNKRLQHENNVNAVRNVVKGLSKTFGTAISGASTFYGGGWALNRLLHLNKPSTLGQFFGKYALPANTADNISDGVELIFNPSIEGAVDLGSGVVLGRFKDLSKPARQVGELVGQGANINNMKNGGLIRKMQTAAGGPLQLTPEELKYLEWSKMTPELKREYRTNRAKSHLLSGPNITNFWEAFQTYIGNRDPENPHLNTGEAPSPGWGKQGITGLHKMMVKLPEAKLVLLAPLAGRSRAAATLKMEDIVKAQLHRDEVYKRWTSLYKLLYDPTPTTFRTKPARIKRLETDISKTNGRTLAGGKGHAGGSYNSKSHTINVTTSKTVSAKNLEDIGFHEGIHSYGLGESPSYYWKTRYLNFPEGTNPYSLDPREIATHGLLQGLNLGIKVGQPYPGKEGLIKIIENRPDGLGFGGIPYTLYNNAKTNADYRRLWSLLNGTFKYGGMLQLLKKGSGIHIKKKNRGKFTSYCGGKVTDECILKGKNSSNPAIRKRATFAANARKWKHLQGGTIVNGLMDIYRSIKLNQAIDASMDAMRLQVELDKLKLFYNEYKKLLGLQTDRSNIVNANKAYNEAKNIDYSDVNLLFLDKLLLLLNLKQQNDNSLINSIGGISGSILNSISKKKNTPSNNNNRIFTTYSFWDNPSFKNSQINNNFWTNPTIANANL